MKPFDVWNILKKKIHNINQRPYYKEGEIWWSNYGIHVGDELDGKGNQCQRPVLILKGLSRNVCLVVPLSTKIHTHKYRILIKILNKDQNLVISQIKVMDCKRFFKKMTKINRAELLMIKQKIRELLL